MPAPNQQQRGKRPKKLSRFGQQMAEKQMLKKTYGIREEQLKKYYGQARRNHGETGPELISLMEARLDNAIYRAGFAATRKQARQLATHRLFEVNGHPVDVPSISLKPNDKVTVRENKQGKQVFENLVKHLENVEVPTWLQLEAGSLGFSVLDKPDAKEMSLPVDIRAVVEYFAR